MIQLSTSSADNEYGSAADGAVGVEDEEEEVNPQPGTHDSQPSESSTPPTRSISSHWPQQHYCCQTVQGVHKTCRQQGT